MDDDFHSSDLSDLLAALREVAANADPDSDFDPNDDNSDTPEDEIPDDADLDGEEGEEDDTDDFSKPKRTNAIMLLSRIEADDRQSRNKQRVAAIIKSQDNSQEDRKRINTIRSKTASIHSKLALKREWEAESAKYLAASMELRTAQLTNADKKAQAEETRRGQILYSRLAPELHPEWREHAQAEFSRRKL
jgi:hypothetical protein